MWSCRIYFVGQEKKKRITHPACAGLTKRNHFIKFQQNWGGTVGCACQESQSEQSVLLMIEKQMVSRCKVNVQICWYSYFLENIWYLARHSKHSPPGTSWIKRLLVTTTCEQNLQRPVVASAVEEGVLFVGTTLFWCGSWVFFWFVFQDTLVNDFLQPLCMHVELPMSITCMHKSTLLHWCLPLTLMNK